MAKHSAEMLRCIRDCDAESAMRLWKAVRPHAAQPENAHQALIMLHYARTKLGNMPQRLRFYSHCWLRGHDLPSALPDHLKPKAERMYPIIVQAVGVSSGGLGGSKGAFNYAIQDVMRDAVLETQADGHDLASPVVKHRMLEKRALFKKRA
jgi:hypothetical protein